MSGYPGLEAALCSHVSLYFVVVFLIRVADTRVDRGLAQAIQQARLSKKMTQKQLATVS